MGLSTRQMVDLKRHLIQQGRFLDRPEERTSRQIEGGMYVGGGERLGERSVLVYIQRGLGSHAEELLPVFQTIFRTHARSSFRHRLNYFSFGWEDGQLRQGDQLCGEENGPTAYAFVTALCELAGTESGQTPATIPCLSWSAASGALAHTVDENDLLVFVCKGGHTAFWPRAGSECRAALERNAVWVLFPDGGLHLECGRIPYGTEAGQ